RPKLRRPIWLDQTPPRVKQWGEEILSKSLHLAGIEEQVGCSESKWSRVAGHQTSLRLQPEEVKMTLPYERTRAVVQTYEFLVELSIDTSLSSDIRRDALFLLRHFPGEADVLQAGRNEEEGAK